MLAESKAIEDVSMKARYFVRMDAKSEGQSSSGASSYYDVVTCAVCNSGQLKPWGAEVAAYRLVQCNRCSFIFVGHRPTTRAICDYYSPPFPYARCGARVPPRPKP